MRKKRLILLAAALLVSGPSTQASGAIILLQDSFDTPGSINDDLGTRQAGSSLGLVGYASESFIMLGSNDISGGQLLLNDGGGLSSQVTMLHDFVDPLILLEEGFRITLDVDPDTTSAGSSDYFALAIGQRASTAGNGFPEVDSSSDFGIRLGGDGSFIVTRGSAVPVMGTYDPTPAINKFYKLDLAVDTASFEAGEQATITLSMDNVPVDLNGASPGTDLIITWDAEGENYISLIGGGASSLVDNLNVALIPEPGTTSAMMFGVIALFAVYRRRS